MISSKRIKILEENELEILDVQLRLIKPLDIRWLSHYQALSRIFESFPAIMQTLQEIYEKEEIEEAHYILAKIEQFQFLFLECVMCDILKIINRPEMYFQKNILTITDFLRENAGEEFEHLEDAKKIIKYTKKQVEIKFNKNNKMLEKYGLSLAQTLLF